MVSESPHLVTASSSKALPPKPPPKQNQQLGTKWSETMGTLLIQTTTILPDGEISRHMQLCNSERHKLDSPSWK